MSGAKIGDLGLLDIGDSRRILVKITRLDRNGFVSEVQRPISGKGKAVFRGPLLAVLTVDADSLLKGVDALLAELPTSFVGSGAARLAIEPYHVPRCANCGAPIPGDDHNRRLCDICRMEQPAPINPYR